MFSKIGALLGSIRFWQVTFGYAAYVLANPDKLIESVSAWFLTIAAIGTVDGIAKRAAPVTITSEVPRETFPHPAVPAASAGHRDPRAR